MKNIRVQNSQEGWFLLNVPRGKSLENIKAVARSFNEVNLLKPGEVCLNYTWKHFDYGIGFKRNVVPHFWALLHWEIERHLYIQANFAASLRAESMLKMEWMRDGPPTPPSPTSQVQMDDGWSSVPLILEQVVRMENPAWKMPAGSDKDNLPLSAQVELIRFYRLA